MADQQKPVVASPVVVAPVAELVVAKPAVALSVVFTAPTWQSKKLNAAKRLADVQLLMSGVPCMSALAFAGLTIAQEDRSVILYLPPADRIGAAKAITPRFVAGTQTVDGQTEQVMFPSRAGERQIQKLSEAIIDAWADANTGNRNPYGAEYALSL